MISWHEQVNRLQKFKRAIMAVCMEIFAPYFLAFGQIFLTVLKLRKLAKIKQVATLL